MMRTSEVLSLTAQSSPERSTVNSYPVPDATGQDPEMAGTTLADEGWDARVHRLPLPLSARGESRVLHQSPAAGTALPEGTAVHVWVG